MNPLAAPFTPARMNTAQVFAADDPDIRENIRYRIYDFVFDIEYDEDPAPMIMQYIRIFNPPPHRLFNPESWARTMVHRPWSHEPRGFHIFQVSRKLCWEARFRFYWFHFPNYTLQPLRRLRSLNTLQRRLSRMPWQHLHSVNALIKFHGRIPGQTSDDPEEPEAHPANLRYFMKESGLDTKDAPWIKRVNWSNEVDWIILGPGFQISQSVDASGQPETLWFAGKLGNLKFLRGRPFTRLDFSDKKYSMLRESFQRFQRRKPEYIKNAIEQLCNAFMQLPAVPSVQDDQRSEYHTADDGSDKASGGTLTAVPSIQDDQRSEYHTADDGSDIASGGILRGGGACERACSADSDRVALITWLLQDNSKGSKFSRENEELLRPVEVRRLTYNLQLKSTDMVTGVAQSPTERTETPCTKLVSEIGIGQEESDAGVHRNDPHLEGSPFSRSTNHARSRRIASACVRGSGSNGTPGSFQRQDQRTDGKCDQNSCPTRVRTRHGASSEDSYLQITSKIAHESFHSREGSFEYRISQWIQREKSPETPSRKSSGSSWLDKDEARALSARMSVSSSSYHTYLSHRSSQRNSSSDTVCSTIPSHSSAKDAAQESLELPTSTFNTDTTVASATTEDPSQQRQGASSSATDPTVSTSVIPAPVPHPEDTTAQAPRTPQQRPSPPPSLPPLSASTDLASTNADGCGYTADSNDGGHDIGDGALPLLCGEEAPLLLPGVKQFLTPKRDAKAWWEAGGGDQFSQCQSTGGKAKAKKKGRRREARESMSSRTSFD